MGWENVLGPIAGAVAGGLMAGKTGSEANKANLQANRENIAAQAANQDKALDLLREDAIQNQLGGPDALKARGNLAFGDIGRTDRLNKAGTDFAFTLPTRADAQGIVDRDNQLQMANFEKGLGDIVSSRQRLGQGIQLPNSKFEGGTVDAIGRFTDANRFGGEREALDLYNKSRESDLSILEQQIAANQRQAPAPGYKTTSGAGANVITQLRPPSRVADLRGAVPWQAGGSTIQTLFAQEAQRKKDAQLDLLIRTLGNQRAGVPT